MKLLKFSFCIWLIVSIWYLESIATNESTHIEKIIIYFISLPVIIATAFLMGCLYAPND